MGSPFELESRNAGFAWALTIAGLPIQYVSHPGYPVRARPKIGGNYRNFTAITMVEGDGGELDLAGGVASYNPIIVDLQSQPKAPRGADEPALVLTRISTRSSTAVARLITTVDQALFGPLALELDRDGNQFGPFPEDIQVNQEAIRVTGALGIGTPADPFRLTIGTRAVLATLPQRHTVSLTEAMRPWVESHVTAWAWRRCILYARPIRHLPGGGTGFGEEIEIRRGFVEVPPKPTGVGVYSLAISALPTVLDRRPAGVTDAVHPVNGWHYFTNGNAVSVEHGQWMQEGGFFQERATAGSLANAPINARTANYGGAFDVTLPTGHPRKGKITLNNAGGGDLGIEVTAVIPAQFTTAPGTPVGAVVLNDHIRSARFAELHRVDIASTDAGTTSLQRWPRDAMALINGATGWAPGAVAGLGGMHADVQIVPRPDGSWGLAVVYNTDHRLNAIKLIFRSGHGHWPSDYAPRPEHWRSGAGERPADQRRLLYYPLDFAEPDDVRFPPPVEQAYAEYLSGEGGQHWIRVLDVPRNTDGQIDKPRIRGIATWFYQSGERYIGPVGTDLSIPASGSLSIEIEYTDLTTGDRARATCNIKSTASVGAPHVGYVLEVTQRDRARLPSFGNWPGVEPVVIRPITRMWDRTTPTMLRRLLLSGGGNLLNPFDQDPFGAGLDEADVASERFTSPDLPGLDRWSIVLRPGDDLRKVVDGALITTSTALVTHRDDQGRCRLARVSVGLEAEHEVIHDITDADLMEVGTHPDSSGRVVGILKIGYNHRQFGDGDPASTVTIPAQHIVSRHADAETLEVDAIGLYLASEAADAGSVLRQLLGRVVALLGQERLQWQIRVRLGLGLRLTLGSVVRITSSHLVGHSKSGPSPWGISGLLGRVVVFDPEYMTDPPSVLLTLHHTGNRSSGWSPSGSVVQAPTATSVILADNAYSDAIHPYLGSPWLDIDAFAVGDTVDLCQRYDQDTFVRTTITAVDRALRRLDFAAGHGFASPGASEGIVNTPTYGLASAYVQRFVHWADNLGQVAGVAGFELT